MQLFYMTIIKFSQQFWKIFVGHENFLEGHNV